MALNDGLRKIISLSAASMALLQSVSMVGSQPSQNASPEWDNTSKDELRAKTDRLMLQTPTEKQPLLYADHSSHSSHDSHSSHYSGTTDDSGDSSDYSTPAPTYPAYTPPPPPPTPPPAPAPQATNASEEEVREALFPGMTNDVTGTNDMTGTNSIADANAAADAADIELLTKAAAQGSEQAQLALGIDYRDGLKGLPKNIERAKMLFEMSAIQGDTDGKLLLDDLNNSETQTNQTQTNNVTPP